MKKYMFVCYRCDDNEPCILIVKKEDISNSPSHCPYSLGFTPTWENYKKESNYLDKLYDISNKE